MSEQGQLMAGPVKQRGFSIDAWAVLLACVLACSNIFPGEDKEAAGKNKDRKLTGMRGSMASSIAISHVGPVNPALRFLKLVPGVLLLAAVGYAGKLLEANVGKYAKAHHWTFPNIEYVLWAILLGLAISNTVRVPEIFRE